MGGKEDNSKSLRLWQQIIGGYTLANLNGCDPDCIRVYEWFQNTGTPVKWAYLDKKDRPPYSPSNSEMISEHELTDELQLILLLTFPPLSTDNPETYAPRREKVAKFLLDREKYMKET